MLSTYAMMRGCPPRSSSPLLFSCIRFDALCSSSLFIFSKMLVRTRPAKSGENGHPCVNPSSTVKLLHLLL